MGNELPYWVKQLSARPLPVWGETRQQLLVLAEHGRYNSAALTRALAHDPLLCAQLLRAANAGRAGGSIATLDQAAVMLGARALHDLAARLPVLEERLPPPALAAMRRLQRRDFHVAWLARELSRRYLDQRYDDAFFAGLLYNLGDLALRAHSPQGKSQTRHVAGTRGIPTAEAVPGLDATTLSAPLARHWRMPILLQAVLDTNHPQEPRSELVRLASAMLRGDSALPPTTEDLRLQRVAETLGEPVEAVRALIFSAASGAAAWLCERLPAENGDVVELFPAGPRDRGSPETPAR